MVEYKNKIYSFLNRDAMNRFIELPEKYTKIITSILKIPNLRICIINSIGCNVMALRQNLINTFQLPYYQFDKILNEYLQNKNLPLITIENRNSLLNEMNDEIFQDLIVPIFKNDGFIFDGFPLRQIDYEKMLKLNIMPNILIITQSETCDEILESTQNLLFNEWMSKQTEQRTLFNQIKADIYKEWLKNREKKFQQLLNVKRIQRKITKRNEMRNINKEKLRKYILLYTIRIKLE